MSNELKDIEIQNHIFYFFADIVNIKNSDKDKIKRDEKSCKNIFIYYIEYETIKDPKYVKINSFYCILNHLYYITNKVNGYFVETMRINIWH